MNDRHQRLREESNYRLDRRTEASLHLNRLAHLVDEAKADLKKLLEQQEKPPVEEKDLPRWVHLLKDTPTKEDTPDLASRIERAKKRVSDMEDQYYRVSDVYRGR